MDEKLLRGIAAPTPLSILDEASAAVKQRRAVYGVPKLYFERAAKFWTVWLEDKMAPGQTVTPADVAMLMTLGKQARLMESPGHRDSIVDSCGYLDCYEAVVEG